ncbi:MAG: hypothetical protein M5U28_31270 [Sandaracinaceae bacterium]|nr:hypothetical protein [Sandaracinaceae bacterium]
MKAPRTCPKSSLSTSVSGSAAQSMATKGPRRRPPCSWSARAASSLPVPVSPSRSTVTSLFAASSSTAKTSRSARLSPTSSPKRRDWLGGSSTGSGSGATRTKVRPSLSVAPTPTTASVTREPS